MARWLPGLARTLLRTLMETTNLWMTDRWGNAGKNEAVLLKLIFQIFLIMSEDAHVALTSESFSSLMYKSQLSVKLTSKI